MKNSFISVFVLFPFFAFSQNKNCCDTIYKSPNVPVSYTGGFGKLNEDLLDQLTPIVSKCRKKYKDTLQSLNVKFDIDSIGHVCAVHFPWFKGKDKSRQLLGKELLKMGDWIPARHGGKAVCTSIPIVLSFKFEE